MFASTRRTSTAPRSWRSGRLRTAVAGFAALSLGLAACGGDEPLVDEEADLEVPAGEDPPGGQEADESVEETASPSFETLEDGEVVPGVRIDAPVDEGAPFQAQPTPTGSAYVAALSGDTGAISLNVEFEGQDLDSLLAGIDTLVESGQAEVTSGPEDIEVEGADEAARVELAAPGGEATATGIFAIADGHSISIAIETLAESDVDVDAIVDSIVIDADRLQAEGVLDLEEPAVTDDAGATDAGSETEGADGTTDAGADGTTDAGADGATDAATEPDQG